MSNASERAWDVFISHASEDKDSLVRPLADELSRFGVRVWYDEFSLKLGDSLSASIDRGLADSEFGVVILSPNFAAKNWPQRELAGLVSGEISGAQVILPIWYKMSREDVYAFSPTLSDKLAVVATEKSDIRGIAMQILERVRPELHQAYQRTMAYEALVDAAELRTVETAQLEKGPIRHDTLGQELANRIRLVHATLIEVFPATWQETYDNFRRDMTPGQEVVLWEHIAAIYQVIVVEYGLDSSSRKFLYSRIFAHVAMSSPEWRRDDPNWATRARELCALDFDPVESNYGAEHRTP